VRVSNQPLFSVLFALLLLSPSSFAFDTPLSDQAVREAYFSASAVTNPWPLS